MFNLKSKIEQETAKYAKGDDAYELQLKNQIRDSLGYANYVDRKNKLSGEPLDMDFSGKLKPEAVSNIVAGETGRRADEQAHLTGLANRADSAAGSLASMASKARGGSSAEKINQMFSFEPEDFIDERIKEYVTNPYKGESDDKIVDYYDFDTFKTDLKNKLINSLGGANKESRDMGGEMGDQALGDLLGEEKWGDVKSKEQIEALVDSKIEQRFPEEARGDFLTTYYQASGYTPAQAEKVSGLTRYAKGQMTEAEKTVYELLNQPTIDNYQGSLQNGKIFDDTKPIPTEAGGKTTSLLEESQEQARPVLDLAKEKYPEVPAAELTSIIKESSVPILKEDDIPGFLESEDNEKVVKKMRKQIEENDAMGFYETLEGKDDVAKKFNSFINTVNQIYSNEVVSKDDVKRMLFYEMKKRINSSKEKEREDALNQPTHVPMETNSRLWGQNSINTGTSDTI